MTPLRPLGDRVLVKPFKNPNETDSGLVLPENRSDQYTEMQGTVVAVGRMTHPRKAEAEQLAADLEKMTQFDLGLTSSSEDVTALLRDLVRREPVVKVGDEVLFSYTVGQEITIDDDRYLLLREDDLLAVLETA